MNELEFKCLVDLLKDDFDGDYQITRKTLLELLTKARWNAKVEIKDAVLDKRAGSPYSLETE